MNFVVASESGKRAMTETAVAGAAVQRKRKRKELLALRSLREHQLHLVCLVHAALRLNEAADDDAVRCAARSLVPEDIRESVQKTTMVRPLLSWFRALFSLEQGENERKGLLEILRLRRGSAVELTQAFVAVARSIGCPARMVFEMRPVPWRHPDAQRYKKSTGAAPLSSMALLAVGANASIPTVWAELFTLDGSPDKGVSSANGAPFTAAGEPAANRPATRKCKAAANATGQRSEDGKTFWSSVNWDDEQAAAEAELLKRKVNEAISGNPPGKWVHVDPVRGLLDSPHCQWRGIRGRLEPGGAEAAAPYVVAFGRFGYGIDVTRRYTRHWAALVKQRVPPQCTRSQKQQRSGLIEARGKAPRSVPGEWLDDKVLKPLRKDAEERRKTLLGRGEAVSVLFEQSTASCAAEQEANELETCTQRNESMPTSVDGMRSHPCFVIESMLSQHEAVVPKSSVVGYFKGEAVFERRNVVGVFSAKRWEHQARRVREEEFSRPFRVVKRRRRGTPATASRAYSIDGHEVPCEVSPVPELELYAEWQTVRWVPPPVVDGKVPRNEYGNWEMWCDACLPNGAVHVRGEFASSAAARLDIDYACAVVGFERNRGQKVVPKIDGVIVCTEQAGIVRLGAAHLEEEKLLEVRSKREAAVLTRLSKLVRGVLIAARIDQRYTQTHSRGARDASEGGSMATASTPSSGIDVAGAAAIAPSASSANMLAHGRCKHAYERICDDDETGMVTERCIFCGHEREFEEM